MQELATLHDRHLNRPTLDDSVDEEQTIEITTKEITQVHFIRRGGRHVGLMVGAQDSRLRCPDSRPGWVIVLYFWAKLSTLTVLLSTKSINGYPQIVREA